MSFASNLKNLMDERNITQVELAIAIGKGKSSVSQYLSGKNIPKPDVQEKIAEVLECTVEVLNGEASAKIEDGMKNVSVVEAARILGKSPQFVRVALQTGAAHFGVAVKMSSKYTYHISRAKIYEYLGMEEGDA